MKPHPPLTSFPSYHLLKSLWRRRQFRIDWSGDIVFLFHPPSLLIRPPWPLLLLLFILYILYLRIHTESVLIVFSVWFNPAHHGLLSAFFSSQRETEAPRHCQWTALLFPVQTGGQTDVHVQEQVALSTGTADRTKTDSLGDNTIRRFTGVWRQQKPRWRSRGGEVCRRGAGGGGQDLYAVWGERKPRWTNHSGGAGLLGVRILSKWRWKPRTDEIRGRQFTRSAE